MSVGGQLRQARGEHKLSIAEVTKATKIQPWILDALEGDRLHEQMSPIYVKGFLTSYAKFLRLDAAALAAQLPSLNPPAAAEAPAAAPREPRTPPAAIKLTLPKFEIPKVTLPKVTLPKFDLPQLSLPRVAWPSVSMIRARQAAGALALTMLVLVVVTGRAEQWLPKKLTLAKATAPKTANVAAMASAKKPESAASLPPMTIAAGQPLELVVSASKTTWIRLRVDGKLLAQQRLERGTSERWVAKKRFDMVLAKPSEVDVALNGQPLASYAIAHQGRLAITHQGIAALPEGSM